MVVLNDFKDFLSIDQFCKIVSRIIQLKINGIYNVSISKKIYIAEILGWLDQNFLENIKLIQSKKDSFTLSNKNLIKKIKINITKQQLKKFCQNLI